MLEMDCIPVSLSAGCWLREQCAPVAQHCTGPRRRRQSSQPTIVDAAAVRSK